MRDYCLTQYFLSVIGGGYVAVVLIALALAIWLPKRKRGKAIASVIVLGLAAILPLRAAKEFGQRRVQAEEFKQRYAKAKALFDERCKAAGEKIFRTIENVEGILLLNVRERGTSASVLQDPNWPDAALPNEPGQDGYIMTFLLWEQFQDKRNDRGYLNNVPSALPGFRFVDVRDIGGTVHRYRLVLPEARTISKELLNGDPARYAVSFVNMTDPADRKLWVAGTKVTVSDTTTNEVIGEKTWYAFEPGQGSNSGDRSAWAFARQCPAHQGWSGASTRFFVDRVLMPTLIVGSTG